VASEYEYSYLTLFSSNDEMDDTANDHQQTYYTHFKGIYSETSTAMAEGVSTDVVLVLGCKTYYDFSNFYGNDNNDLYGQCMEGWIHTLVIETYDSRQEITPVTTVRDRHHASGAAGANFINDQQTTYTANDWSPVFMTIQDTQLFVWDLLNAPGADQSTSDQFECDVNMVALAGDREYPPFFLEEVGRIFYNETSYFTCTI